MLRIQLTYLVTLPQSLGYPEEKLCDIFVESYGVALEKFSEFGNGLELVCNNVLFHTWFREGMG
jgi:hypothetical protein